MNFFILLNLNTTLVENVSQPVSRVGCVFLIRGFRHAVALGCTCVPGALSFFLSCGFLQHEVKVSPNSFMKTCYCVKNQYHD